MPSNLFVVVFPKIVQAHTVFVDRKEKPRSKWSVGGLRSPPGLLGRDGKGSRGDDKNNAPDQISGRDHTSIGSPNSGGSSTRSASLARQEAAGSAASNELKNQRTVRVQLCRPTEDMVPEKQKQQQQQQQQQRRGSFGAPPSQQQQHRRAESNGASWHAPSTHQSSSMLSREESAASSGGSAGGSLGASGTGSGGGAEWARGVLKDHKKSQPFIHIPSRSEDASSGSLGGRRGSLSKIFREQPSSASVGGPDAGGDGEGGGGSSSRSRAAVSVVKDLVNRARSSSGGDGRGDHIGDDGDKSSHSSVSSTSTLGLENSNIVGVESGSEAEELVGADSAGNGGVVVNKADAAKLEKLLDKEDQPDKVPANRRAKEDREEGGGEGGGGEQKEQRQQQEEDGEKQQQQRQQQQSQGEEGESRHKRRKSGSVAGPGSPMEPGATSRGLERLSARRGSDVGETKEEAGGEDGTGDEDGEDPPTTPEDSSTPGSKRRLVTEVIGDGDDVDVSRPQDMDEGERVDIEQLVRGILVEMRGDQLLIGEPTYHLSASGKLMTCIFPCDVEDAHLVLTRLESVGVGSEIGSVNVLPMEIGRSDITRRRREKNEPDEDKARRARHNRATGGRFGDSSSAGMSGDGSGGSGGDKEEEAARRANERFRALASQIRVTQVTEEIREGTKCHFDYMALLVASSAISAMGLATDNVAVVVAAMLVSPIMGPVLAFTFGTNVRDWSLAKKGFLVESFSLLICVGVGFLVGMVGVNFIEEPTWPTHEMETRGNAWGLLTGICIAIPSGMAVALSILSKNVNSLVGVAISASLLPPAVNTGLCLAVALVGPYVRPFHIDVKSYVMIGLVSMSLTIVNILSIYVAGVWLFIFKEVAPIKSENSFWSQDMIHARKFQQRLGKGGGEGGEAAHNLRKTLLEAANRHRDGTAAGEGGFSESDRNLERKSSFSSTTNTHHRYRHKDRRRRPTVFDLFPDVGDSGPSEEEGEYVAPEGVRDSIKSETGRLLGLLKTKFVDRGDDHANGNNNTVGAGGSSCGYDEQQPQQQQGQQQEQKGQR